MLSNLRYSRFARFEEVSMFSTVYGLMEILHSSKVRSANSVCGLSTYIPEMRHYVQSMRDAGDAMDMPKP
jgi:hypothetical protein